VATDLPVLRRVLTHGHNALLVPPDDPAALRVALEQLAAQPVLAGQLAANARADAAQHTWLRRAEKILGTLND
ncbi:MAG: glycosyltransferase, partial [Chloroflexi bacterium]|nr:glycosyltransferase [Chloroflexota bacterium]